jgi:hypothetical protein
LANYPSCSFSARLIIKQVWASLAIVMLTNISFISAQETVPAQLDTAFKLKLGHEAVIESEGIVVIFADVPEDSRCPSDVMCIWQGLATVNIYTYVNGIGQELILTVGAHESSSSAFDQYFMKVVGLQPQPHSNIQIDPQDYVVTLVVSEISAKSESVFITATGENIAVVTGWNIQKGKGTLVMLNSHTNWTTMTVYRFVPSATECTQGPKADKCMEGQVLHGEFRGQTSTIRMEILDSRLWIFTGGSMSEQHTLDVKEIRTRST